MANMRAPSPSDMKTLLGVLLAPEEDSPATAQALLKCFHDTGVTLLGHAVAWGYSEALPPLLAAARYSPTHPSDCTPLKLLYDALRASQLPALSASCRLQHGMQLGMQMTGVDVLPCLQLGEQLCLGESTVTASCVSYTHPESMHSFLQRLFLWANGPCRLKFIGEKSSEVGFH